MKFEFKTGMFSIGLAVLAALCSLPHAARPLNASDEIPGGPQKQPIAIVGGTIHTISGPDIERGTVLLVDGKIAAVNQKLELPPNTKVIDAKGRHVYPGLIESSTDLGLIEIGAVKASNDKGEAGAINSNIKAAVSVNPDSELIPVARANGVLIACVVPAGGVIAGQGSMMMLDGWTYEQMTIKDSVGMIITWPRPATLSGEGSGEGGAMTRQIRQAFESAVAYRKARDGAAQSGHPHPPDARWEAMIPVLEGKLPVIAAAEGASTIQSAVAFAAEWKIKMIIFGGYEADQCADLLKKHDIPVVAGPVFRLPRNRDDAYDAPFTLPHRLQQAGVKFAISGKGRFNSAMVRNLPYHAATASAYGLSRADALRAITLGPAEIFGIADRVGSIQPGKDATLFIADGDILEIATNVQAAWVQGREVDLSSKHVKLWKKYQEKQRQEAGK